jgi:hypothetical protein
LRLKRVAIAIVGEFVVSSRLVEIGVVGGLRVQLRVTVLPDRRVTVQFVEVLRVGRVRRIPKATQLVVVGVWTRRISIDVGPDEHRENNVVVGDDLGSDGNFLSVGVIECPGFGRTVVLVSTIGVRVHVAGGKRRLKQVRRVALVGVWAVGVLGTISFPIVSLPFQALPLIFLLVQTSTKFVALSLAQNTVFRDDWQIAVLVRQHDDRFTSSSAVSPDEFTLF